MEYPSEAVRDVLSKTLGVPLFQEQAMKLVVVAAGFTPGEADQLRRAMGAWKRTGVINQFEQKLIDGMLANGYSEEFARNLFRQIEGFGSYGFPESHAASFALLVYVSAWIKCHHPAVFLAALLNSQPMGFYGPAQLVADARRHGVEVRPVDVNQSDWDSTLERREGRRHAGRSAGLVDGQRIVAERGGDAGPRASDPDRSRLMATSLRAPASRRRFCPGWRRPMRSARSVSRVGRPTGCRWPRPPPEPLLPTFPTKRRLRYRGFRPLRKSFMTTMPRDSRSGAIPSPRLRRLWMTQHVVPASALQDVEGRPALSSRRPGSVRQRPGTAKGITFMTLEDETGSANLIVWPQVWERYRRVGRQARALIATGLLQRQDGVIHLIVDRLQDLTTELPNLGHVSRDFH